MSWALFGESAPGTDWSYRGYVRTGTPASHVGSPATTEPSDNETLSRALAATDPNKPHVSVPNFVAELRDFKFKQIPQELSRFSRTGFRLYGNVRLKDLQDLGTNYLSYEYGIKPFMKDLYGMMAFVNKAEEKFRYLKKLQANKTGLGNHATVWECETFKEEWDSYVSGLYSESNRVRETWTTTHKKWASTLWVPTVDLSQFSDNDLYSRAQRVVSGMDLSFATLWEAMPWSWLIDWFSNAGDMYQLSRNTIPVDHSGSCIMRSVHTGITKARLISGAGMNSCRVRPNKEARVELKRTPLYGIQPRLEFNLPLFDGRQLSILSALTVTRL
jgi:hypothetical protein